MSTEDLPDECLSKVFSLLSIETGSYEHALVCRRWRALAPEAQLAAAVESRKLALPAPVLLGELSAFRGLVSLRLGPGSLQLLTDRLLQGLSAQCPRLQGLHIAQQAAPVSCFSAAGLADLFAGCPGLKACCLHTCGDVLELPGNIASLQKLEVREAAREEKHQPCDIHSTHLSKGGASGPLQPPITSPLQSLPVVTSSLPLGSGRRLSIAQCKGRGPLAVGIGPMTPPGAMAVLQLHETVSRLKHLRG